ncbi:hypothetical protein AB0H17_28480 [Streptomyces olivoreticuli]
MPLLTDESGLSPESWPADRPRSHPSAFLAERTRRATADLIAALDALEYLIVQIKEVHEPLSGVQACFSQAFSDVQLALARREILERLRGTFGEVSSSIAHAGPANTLLTEKAGERMNDAVIYG